MQRKQNKSLLRLINEYGFRGAFEKALIHIWRSVFSGSFRRNVPPRTGNLFSVTDSIYLSPTDMISNYIIETSIADYGQIIREYQELAFQLKKRYNHNSQLAYREKFGIGEGTSLLLYMLARIEKPEVILETGVANGRSTYYLLNALNRNRKGILYSIDISSNVGGLLQKDEKSRWRFKCLDIKRMRKDFREFLNSLPWINIFIHDSNHSYEWQYFEYETAAEKMAANSILATDDADASLAFNDFCRKNNLRPAFLVDSRKVFGVVRLD